MDITREDKLGSDPTAGLTVLFLSVVGVKPHCSRYIYNVYVKKPP